MILAVLVAVLTLQGFAAEPLPPTGLVAVLPDSDLTILLEPYSADGLKLPDSAGGRAIFVKESGTGERQEALLLLHGMVGSRTTSAKVTSGPVFDSLLKSRGARLREWFGKDPVVVCDTLYDGDRNDLLLRTRWRWDGPRGAARLDGRALLVDSSANGRCQRALDSVFHQYDPQGRQRERARRLANNLMPDPDSFWTVTSTLWNPLSPVRLLDAMSSCLRFQNCAFPAALGTAVRGSDTIRLVREELADAWMPNPTDTFHRTQPVGDGSMGFEARQIVGKGLVDSLSEFQLIESWIDADNLGRIADSLQVLAVRLPEAQLQNSLDWIDTTSEVADRDLSRALARVTTKSMEPSLTQFAAQSIFEECPRRELLVRKRAVTKAWPLENGDVTQKFKPMPRRPSRSRDWPEAHPIGTYSSYEEEVARHLVLFVDGKVQQRSFQFGWSQFQRREQLDSAYLSNLEELRRCFGQEAEDGVDTANMAGQRDASVIATKVWFSGGGDIRMIRMDEFLDTATERKVILASLQKMSELDPSLDSAQIQTLREQKLARLEKQGSRQQGFTIILSNSLEPIRLVRAMGACLEQADCSPEAEAGVVRSGDSVMVVTSITAPPSWFPINGAVSVQPVPEDAGEVFGQIVTEKLEGRIDGRFEYSKLSRHLGSDATEEIGRYLESAFREVWQEMAEQHQTVSTFDSLEACGSIPTIEHILRAGLKSVTRLQDMTVRRLPGRAPEGAAKPISKASAAKRPKR